MPDTACRVASPERGMVAMRIVLAGDQHVRRSRGSHGVRDCVHQALTGIGQAVVGKSKLGDLIVGKPEEPGGLLELGHSHRGVLAGIAFRWPLTAVCGDHDLHRGARLDPAHHGDTTAERLVVGMRRQDQARPATGRCGHVGARHAHHVAQDCAERWFERYKRLVDESLDRRSRHGDED